MNIMSKRIQVTLPDRLADELEQWSDFEGRPLSNLCAYLLENAVRDSKRAGDEWTLEQSPKTPSITTDK